MLMQTITLQFMQKLFYVLRMLSFSDFNFKWSVCIINAYAYIDYL